ncbi:TadE family protein [Rhodoferax sp.]|uniref:TadE family protein n=1 Tax=Rhodoferax sp. TaxID=50421 RepID=UPI00275C6498|nr:pilus assembly protein [Rhodoferax sp.]
MKTGVQTARKPRKAANSQSGQAMVEFVVVAMFFLVPMFLAITVLGKFVDVQHTTDMAARYGAWERTVWYEDSGSDFNKHNAPNTKSSDEIRNEIAARLLNDRSSSGTVIKAADKSATGFVNGLDPMWRDPSGTVYLTDYAQLATAVKTEGSAKGIAGTIASGAMGALPKDSLAVATVGFKTLAQSSGTYQRLWVVPEWKGLDFAATGAVLSNTWAANASDGTLNMVAPLVPLRGGVLKGALKGYAGLMDTWDGNGAESKRLEIGKIAVDEVPADRLK